MHKVKSNKKLIVLFMVVLVFAISICYTAIANAEEDVTEEPYQAPVDIPAGDNQNENTSVFYPGFKAEEGGSVSAGAMECMTEENHYVLSFGSDNVVRAIFPAKGWGEVKEVTPIPDDGYKFDAWYDEKGNKIEPGSEKGWYSAAIITAKFVEDEPTLVPIHVDCDARYLTNSEMIILDHYDWAYSEETKTWSNEFSSDTTYAQAMEGWKNVKPKKDGYIFKGFSPEPDDQHFLTQEITFNPIFEKSVKGKTITFITGDFKEAWGDQILAVFYNKDVDTEQHYMIKTEPGIFLVEIENDKSTSVKFNTNGPINKVVDAGEIPNVDNPTFILTSEDSGEWHKEPDPPKPDPQPDPSSDTGSGSASSNALGSAQTGDSSPIVLLVIVAIVSGVFVLRRKFN